MNYSGATSSRQPLRSRLDAKREQNGDDAAADFIEFVESSFYSKNWRGVFIALLVIGTISGLILLAILLVTPEKNPGSTLEQLTLDELFDDRFQPFHCRVTWSTDNPDVFRYRSRDGDVIEFNAKENRSSIILHNLPEDAGEYDQWSVSSDGQYILVAYDSKPVHTFSFTARYKVHNREPPASSSSPSSSPSSESLPISFPYSDKDSEKWKNARLQYAEWSPKDNGLVFVYKNNIYYQRNFTSTPVQLTMQGRDHVVFSGVPDWLYEEEILHSNVAHWWSPDGKFIAYLCFNDTLVPSYRYPVYSSTYGVVEMTYPKAGDERTNILPVVHLYVIDMTVYSKSTPHRVIRHPSSLDNQEFYVKTVQWIDPSHLLVVWMNRIQDKSISTVCDVISTDCHENLVEEQRNGKGWVSVESILFIDGGKRYLTILPHLESDSGYWKHIAIIAVKEAVPGSQTFVTNGLWDVVEIVGFDERLQVAYFIATKEDPKERHLYRVFLPTGSGRHGAYPECLSCSRIDVCRYVSAQFSLTAAYYVEGCLGPNVPVYTLKKAANLSTVITLEDNLELTEKLKLKALPLKDYFQFSTDDGYSIWGQIIFSPILKKENISSFPLLIASQSEPGSQSVTDEFRLDWTTYLASKGDVVIASFDGRGSGGRGDRFRHETYKRLGTVEVQDQIRGASHVISLYPFVRKDRLSVWGEGYGGFIAAHVLGDKDDDSITCGISLSPITDWRYCDVAYAERLMGSAGSRGNYRGYDNANVSSKSDNFKNKSFLLIHSTANEKTHVQHSALLSKALMESGVDFKFHLFTEDGRRLLGNRRYHGSAGRHAYRTMEAFLRSDCWQSTPSYAVRGAAPRPTRSTAPPTAAVATTYMAAGTYWTSSGGPVVDVTGTAESQSEGGFTTSVEDINGTVQEGLEKKTSIPSY